MSETLNLSKYQQDRPQIAKVRYTHDAMIDLIIENPWKSQNELAAHFGYTPSWISTIFSSDAFQARLAERKDALVDPVIRQTIEEKFKALVHQSFEVLKQKLETSPSDELVLKTLEIASKAAGFGAKATTVNVNQNNFVVRLPEKEKTSEAWEAKHADKREPVTIEQKPGLDDFLGET